MERLKEYPDDFNLCTVEDDTFFHLMKDEEHKQLVRWGVQKITLFEWLAILQEEVGELAKAVMEHEYRNGTKKEISNEAVQVAMVSQKIARLADIYGKDRKESYGKVEGIQHMKRGGTARAIQSLAIWITIITLFIIGILWVMPRKKNYHDLHRRVNRLERLWQSQ